MAQGREPPNQTCVDFQHLDPQITQILSEVDAKSGGDILDSLETDIENDCLEDARDYLFKVAHGRYLGQLTEHGIQVDDKAGLHGLQVKKRRGQNATRANGRDLLELYMYAMGHKKEFPKDVLSNVKNFVEIHFQGTQSSADNSGGGADITTCVDPKSKVSPSSEWQNKLEELDTKWRLLKEEFELERHAKDQKMHRLADEVRALKSDIDVLKGRGEAAPKPIVNGSVQAELYRSHVYIQNTPVKTSQNASRANQTEQITQGQASAQLNGPPRPNPELLGDSENINSKLQSPLVEATNSQLAGAASANDGPRGVHTADSATLRENADRAHQMAAPAAETTGGATFGSMVAFPHLPAPSGPPLGSKGGINAADGHASSTPKPHSTVDTARGDNKWSTVTRKQRNTPPVRRVEYNAQLDASSNSLRGHKPEKTVTLYVKNLATGDGETDEKVKNKLKTYIKRRKPIRIINVQVVHNRFCEDTVGCRIVVPVSAEEILVSPGFWPDDVECRAWTKRRQGSDNRRRPVGSARGKDRVPRRQIDNDDDRDYERAYRDTVRDSDWGDRYRDRRTDDDVNDDYRQHGQWGDDHHDDQQRGNDDVREHRIDYWEGGV